MKIIFMGTSAFAVPSLEALVNAGHEVALVVTQPDRPSGRGQSVHKSPVKQVAERMGLPVFQPEKIRERSAIDELMRYAPVDAIVVASFGQIIPQEVLDIPKYGSINVHASLLPKYRGAAPIHHALLAGEKWTGVTTMLMDAGLDTGDILLKRAIAIDPWENTGELEGRLAAIGADLLIETLYRLEQESIEPEPQDETLATVAKSIKREQGRIDWRKPAEEIVNLVRAFAPRPAAVTLFDGVQVKVFKAEAAASAAEGIPPGQVVEISGDVVTVAAGEGVVRLLEVQPENRRRMSAGEFARGARLEVGMSFAQP